MKTYINDCKLWRLEHSKSTHNVKNINKDIIQDVLMYVISFVSFPRSSLLCSLQQWQQHVFMMISHFYQPSFYFFHVNFVLFLPFLLFSIFILMFTVHIIGRRGSNFIMKWKWRWEEWVSTRKIKLTCEMIITQRRRRRRRSKKKSNLLPFSSLSFHFLFVVIFVIIIFLYLEVNRDSKRTALTHLCH